MTAVDIFIRLTYKRTVIIFEKSINSRARHVGWGQVRRENSVNMWA